MSNELQNFSFEGKDLAVKEIDGQIHFNAEQAAFGLGITQVKNGKVYVQWKRVNNYLNNVSAHVRKEENSPQVEKGDFITEPQFYKLAIKANNPVAEKFQDWVTGEVLPSIRKHGAYMTEETVEEILTNPDTIIKLATQLKEERLAHQKTKEEKLMVEQQYNEAKPKITYYDIILQNPSLVSITQIAKDYGMSGKAMNQKLKELKIQYKQSGTWFLYSKYQDKGWTSSETKIIPTSYGDKVTMYTKWTQKGRLALYDILKEKGILPMIERNNQD